MTTSSWNKYVLLMWKNWLLQWRHKLQSIIEIFVPVLFSALLVLIRGLVEPETINHSTSYDGLPLTDLDHLRESIKKKRFDFRAFLFKRYLDENSWILEFNDYFARNFTLLENNNITLKLFDALGDLVANRDKNFTRLNSVDYRLAFSPANELLKKLVHNAGDFLRLNGTKELQNSTDLFNFMGSENTLAGIEFPDSYHNITKLPDDFTYAIRFPSELRTGGNNPLVLNWRTDLLFPIFQTGGPRNPLSDDGGLPPGYYREGFLNIQNAISSAFISLKSLKAVPPIFIKRFPYPAYTSDVLLQGLESFVSIIILLSFVYPCINLVKFIATEKEKQLKEAMKIMGLPNWLHWTAWFTKAIIFMMISISLIIGLLKISMYPETYVAVLTYSDWSAIWMFLFVYSITTISFCFMMSVFFSKANTATAVTGLVWFLIYSPFTFTQQNYGLLSLSQKLSVSLFSNTAMAYGFQLILRHEGTGIGLQWNNIWKTVTPDDDLTVGALIMMMLADAVIYFLVTLYVEKVKPGDFGVAEKWYFPVTKSFWCGTSEYTGVGDISSAHQKYDSIETEPSDKYAGVQVKDLRKVYANKKVAVQGLTINMYEDQITVLLGHNGAGKTTTMSMLTGMFPPSSGTALVNGKDIRTDIIGVRSSLGLCPQHNILFDELTVREHIIFYSRLKGLDKSDIEKEIIKYVDLLELQPKINSKSSTLSGGMQRKLSVGVALCGGSKVVLCDEPTSGMDPAARRALWDLLQKEKKGRTILLSTHFMDEADILGDRIAIMSDGYLKACGSSFFLKKKFGVGYHLICVKGPDCNVRDTTNLLRKYVPNIEVETDIGTELSYELSDTYAESFETMLSDLEDHSKNLGLLGYGVSLTTLEEVFMRVGTDATNKITLDAQKIHNNEKLNEITNGNLNGNHKYENGSIVTISSMSDTTPLLHGTDLVKNQIIAMIEKKFWYTIRNWILFLVQIIIPVAFIVMTIMIVRTWAGGTDLPPLSVQYESYDQTYTVLQGDANPPSAASKSFNHDVFNEYKNLFRTIPEKHRLLVMTDDMENYILKLGETMISRVNQQYLTAATVTEENLTVWYNNQPYHSSPLALNMMHNAIYRASDTCKDCHINVVNKPIPYTTQSRMDMLQAGNNMGFQLAFNCGFALAFVSAFYVLFYIKERVSRAKLLQVVSGVNIYIFWLTALCWDFMTFIITTIFAIITMAIFQEDGWATGEELGRVFVLWMCFGFSMLPLTYLLSMLFTIPSTGFVRIAIFNIFTGIALFCIVFIMGFDGFDLKDVADSLTWFFLLFPHFSLSVGLSNLNIVNTVLRTCDRCVLPFCDPAFICVTIPMCCEKSYFKWNAPGIGRNIFYLLAVGLGSMIILLLKELRVIETLIYKGRNLYKGLVPPQTEDAIIDSDVLAEKIRINQMSPLEIGNNNLVLKNMTKFYNKFLAVNQICVAVNESQCFGLLGVNGAGKTSTFKMLTGDEKISFGEAWVKGISLKNNMKRVHQEIGYCPQFDALIEDLTGRETLRIFCLLRGVERKNIKSLSLKLANELNFLQHIDKRVKEYSGGNKRKLSTAVALIGNPSVLYLDEPTTGMDPGAKRQLWNMVCRVRESGKTIILTSHSMEECEALCTRLAIMVNGEFKCIGSTQYLKNKFSKGYILSIKIKKTNPNNKQISSTGLSENIDKIKAYVSNNFPSAFLQEEYQGLLTYGIPGNDMKWSKMFGIMQKGKTSLNIEDYSLSQTSLEQVFLSFTQHQRDENLVLPPN